MLTVGDLSNRLGLTKWQTRRVVYALRPVLGSALRSANGQALQVDSSVIGILDRAAQLRASGTSLGRLADVIREELGSNGKHPSEEVKTLQPLALDRASPPQGWVELVDELRERVHGLERDKIYLQEQLVHALGRCEALEQLALPPARSHRRWWLPWRSRN